MLIHGKIVFEETFRSPEKETKYDALIALDKIREVHDASHGWEEKSGYVEKLPNGKWRAVRHHVKHEIVNA